MPQISGPNSQEKHIIETCKEEGCTVSTQETAARSKWEMEHLTRDYRILGPIAVPICESSTNSREEISRTSNFEKCSPPTALRGSCLSVVGLPCSNIIIDYKSLCSTSTAYQHGEGKFEGGVEVRQEQVRTNYRTAVQLLDLAENEKSRAKSVLLRRS
jgi:hypothetical protein